MSSLTSNWSNAMTERLESKKVNGRTYYYYSGWGWVKDKRGKGKCRRLWQKYLGTVQDIVKAVEGGPPPMHAELFSLGLPQALWQECVKQRVIETIDELCPKRDQGLSVGQYIGIAAINRATMPVSKRSMWEWFCSTVLLRRITDASEAALASQRFWDHMERINTATARQIWAQIIEGVLKREGIELSDVCYDGTNFYTFISSFNTRNHVAKRGKNKQGRSDLRQVSYGLFCTQDSHLPLFYNLYEGNRNDSPQFGEMVEAFHEFLQTMAGPDLPRPKVTLVFDKGNNSLDNFKLLDTREFDFIGSVKVGEHKDLACISNQDDRFVPCSTPELDDVKAFEQSKKVYGKVRRLIVVFNQNLFQSQLQTVHNDIDRALGKLGEVRQRLLDRANGLIKGGRAPTEASIKKQCEEILKRQYLSDLIGYEIIAEPGSVVQLQYEADAEALKRLTDTKLGKSILITSLAKEHRNTEQVISTYHGQYVIEHIFKAMKDRRFGNWWPLNHWKDEQIEVHALYCSIAVLLRSLMYQRVSRAGLAISMKRMLIELDTIKEVVNVYAPKRRQKDERRQSVLSKTNHVQQKLMAALDVELT
jgi:transposase